MDLKRKAEEYNNILSKKRKIDIDYHDLMCPITREIFYDPVTASDGITYEKWAIQKIFNSNNVISPLTREPLNYYTENKFVLNLVTNLIKENPELKDHQFSSDAYHDYLSNKEYIIELISQHKFKEIANYKDIMLDDIIIKLRYSTINNEDFIKIIDKSCDVFTKHVLHEIFSSCNFEIIDYLIMKNNTVTINNLTSYIKEIINEKDPNEYFFSVLANNDSNYCDGLKYDDRYIKILFDINPKYGSSICSRATDIMSILSNFHILCIHESHNNLQNYIAKFKKYYEQNKDEFNNKIFDYCNLKDINNIKMVFCNIIDNIKENDNLMDEDKQDISQVISKFLIEEVNIFSIYDNYIAKIKQDIIREINFL